MITLVKIAATICVICSTVRFGGSFVDYFNGKKYGGVNFVIALIEMLAMIFVADFLTF